ncbi:uncharacterized protein VICG_00835 [Vittaforma corneae ATCC 50505]|uniref:Uncharacterized protein n=1 Tax=Vittaforma corneae (strain ATCC 50505) TaxID=993615 RepID=L2GPG3_VITCO|nr:uncharacterized protein VICG_00835 [Vittaforma corneae ATCC 50505]ELA42192.1 hypothetical protein VICG_00835 [Vittaforma corneae ATCC 50505]
MLIEALCRYQIETNRESFPISNVGFKKLTDPMCENDWLVALEHKIHMFSGRIMYFNTSSTIDTHRVFSIEETITNKHIEFPFTVGTFDSVYPCTDIFAIEHPDKKHNASMHHIIVFEFAVNLTKEEALKEAKRMQPGLYFKNDVLTSSRWPTHNRNSHSQYIIRALDGDIPVDISVLKRENVTRMYFNANTVELDLSQYSQDNILSNDIFGGDASSSHENSTFCSDNLQLKSTVEIINQMENIKIFDNESAKIGRADQRHTHSSNEDASVLFEHSNDSGYITLIKAFLKDERVFNWSKYNFIRHCIIQSVDTLYFIFFKVKDTVTVVLSRRLYNYIALYNYIISSEGINTTLLNVPDLNVENNSENNGSASLIEGDSSNTLNFKYKIPDFDCLSQAELITKYSAIVLEENTYSFWFLIKLKEILHPFKFPGLVLSPTIRNMEYLLNGPYPFLVTSKEEIQLDGKLVFTCSTPIPTSTVKKRRCRSSVNTKGKSSNVSMKSLTGRLGRTISGTISGFTKSTSRSKSILNKKGEYIHYLLSNKKKIEHFPTVFHASTLLEQYFVNEPKRYPVDYIFNIVTGNVSFKRGNFLNLSDAVSLWMMIYPGKIDLECLIRKRWINLEYLCRRACIDCDVSMLRRIIEKAEGKASGKTKKPLFKIRMSKRYRIYRMLRRICSKYRHKCLLDVLQSIYAGSILRINLSLNDGVRIREGQLYSTAIEYKGNAYRLMRIEDIISCVESKYHSEQIDASIIAYLTHFNLPFYDSKSDSQNGHAKQYKRNGEDFKEESVNSLKKCDGLKVYV